MEELGYMALEEYDPGAAFPGVIGRATDESSPAWPAGRRCPRRVPELGTRWRRGYGGWVREIVIWAKAPFLFRNQLVVADAAAGAARAAKPGEVMWVGKHAAMVVLAAGVGARIEVAVPADGRERAAGPFAVGGLVR
jgi:hypothetical protein